MKNSIYTQQYIIKYALSLDKFTENNNELHFVSVSSSFKRSFTKKLKDGDKFAWNIKNTIYSQ